MAPAAVLRCEGQPDELILIELQSTVYMEDGSKLVGQHLGTLEIGKEGNVTLNNGPRCLYGKMQVLMEKTGQEDASGDSILATRGVVYRKAVFNQRPQLSV